MDAKMCLYEGVIVPSALYKINKWFFFANEGVETGIWVTKTQITRVKINRIRLIEPLEYKQYNQKRIWDGIVS